MCAPFSASPGSLKQSQSLHCVHTWTIIECFHMQSRTMFWLPGPCPMKHVLISSTCWTVLGENVAVARILWNNSSDYTNCVTCHALFSGYQITYLFERHLFKAFNHGDSSLGLRAGEDKGLRSREVILFLNLGTSVNGDVICLIKKPASIEARANQ